MQNTVSWSTSSRVARRDPGAYRRPACGPHTIGEPPVRQAGGFAGQLGLLEMGYTSLVLDFHNVARIDPARIKSKS